MMTADQFKKAWRALDKNLSPISRHRLTNLGLSKETFDFLASSGLPEDAAPFLSFCKNVDDPVYGINKLTDQYDFPDSDLDKYIAIGFCSNGDPIAINLENDEIKRLDHENDFAEEYFNTSINALAECLLAYRNFVLNVIKDNGEDAFLDSNFSDLHFDKLKNDLISADPKILSEKGFWHEQLEMNLAMREQFKNNNK